MEPLALHALHEKLGASFGVWNEREIVEHYGSPAAEYAAWRSGAALFDLSHRQLLRAAGNDRVSFLQGMLTNDVQGLPVGDQTYAALLTTKGSMICDVRVLKRESDVLLEFEAGLAPKAKATLEKYIVSEDVEISDVSGDFGLLAVAGPQADALLAQPFGEDVFVLRDDVLGTSARRLLISKGSLGAIAQRLLSPSPGSAPRPAGMQTYEVVRVQSRIPRYGIDMDEQTIPLEANLQRAISYTKGCYIGQEVIARATYRGHVNRLLCGLILEDHLPQPKTALFREGKAVGFVTSAVRSFEQNRVTAMGYVHRESSEPGTQLNVDNNGIARVGS
jgi:folate-binding protein YgfZ